MEDRVYKVKMYLYDDPVCDDIYFYQNDTNTCTLEFEFFRNRKDYYDLSNSSVVIIITKNDGTSITDTLKSVNGIYSYELTNNAIDNIGNNKITIQAIGQNNNRVTFGSFKYKLTKDVLIGNIASDVNYPILVSLIAEARVVLANEPMRVANENVRIANEVKRIANDGFREKDYASLKKIIIEENQAANLQNQINKNSSDLADNAKKVEKKNYGLKPLAIEIPFGLNEPYHPSVVYIAGGFNGYKFWMAETPLPITSPLYRDRYECPCIHASNNGVDWVQPTGLVNPIDDLTPQEITNQDYFSDVHLVYRADTRTLECWYRITRKTDKSYLPLTLPTFLIRKTTTNGTTWNEREIMSDFNVPSSPLYPMVRSQALVWSGSKYMMWFVDGDVSGMPVTARSVKYSESVDGKTWTQKQNCGLWNSTVIPWHIDVQYNDGTYHMIVYRLARDNGGVDDLTHFASSDKLNWSEINLILEGNSVNKTTNFQGLYRSCAVRVGALWYLYISCNGLKRTFLGLMIGTKLSELNLYDGNLNEEKQVFAKGIRLIKDPVFGTHTLEIDFDMPIKFKDIKNIYQSLIGVGADNSFNIGNLAHKGDVALYGGSERVIKTDSMIPMSDNTNNLGSTTNHYKNVHLKGFVQPGRFLTANRPLDALTGAIIYDVNLGKPIYWDGVSKWKDFNGNVV